MAGQSLFRNSFHSSDSVGAPGTENGGMNITLLGQRMELQIHTLKVTQPNQRIDFELLSKVQNERIVGFFITSDEVVENELMKDVNHSTISLNIDNTEIFPSETDASLFTQKMASGFYENMYDSINEKAGATSIKGTYISGGPRTCPERGYTVKLYFVETAKTKS